MSDIAKGHSRTYDDLFVSIPKNYVYAEFEQELEAVASGAKAMSMTWVQESIDNLDAQFPDLSEFARRNGLVFTHHRTSNGKGTSIFVVQPNEVWRVPAFMETRRVLKDYEWNDGLEFLESRLLGYSVEQAREWAASRWQTGVGLQGRLVCLVMSQPHAETVRARRGFWLPPASNDGCLVCAQPPLGLKDDLPDLGDLVLGRFVLKRKPIEELIEKPLRGSATGIITLPWTSEVRDCVWSGLKQRVELFVDRHWI
jgi:hypothetical protein